MKQSTQSKKRIILKIIIIISILVSLYLVVNLLIARSATKAATDKLHAYPTKTADLPSGKMTYIDEGDSDTVILVAHGINGGYDQGFESVKNQASNYRIIAPSRFGYPGSPLPSDASPANQAKAYVELLNHLKIEKAYILGTSAGGTIAIRFALDHPERTSGLILYCSAAPFATKPETYLEYQGPPKPLLNDFAFTLIKPLFPMMMGLPPSAADGSMPLAERVEGIDNDASVTNPDMAKNFDDYPIEKLTAPTLIFHAKDDKVAPYDAIEQAAPHFPNKTFISFETGGHMMEGNDQQINQELRKFIE